MSDPVIPGPTWVDPMEVAVLVGMGRVNDPNIATIIVHVEGLCELEIGEQELPLSRALRSVVAEIAVRLWRASRAAAMNPEGVTQGNLGPAGFSQPSAESTGLGLTDREKDALRQAVGKSSLWVLSTTRGPVETPGPLRDWDDSL